MTDTSAAQAWLQERMGEGWRVIVSDHQHPGTCDASAVREQGPTDTGYGQTRILGRDFGGDPQAAAEVCWAAWQDATARERERGAVLGRMAKELDHLALKLMFKDLAAERAHADRLAEALRNIPVDLDAEDIDAINGLLAAHDASRAGSGGEA